MKKNLLFLAIALYIGGCTYKDDLAKVNFIRKRYEINEDYNDPYEKYIIHNGKKRTIRDLMIYDSSGELIEYRYYLGMEGFISHTKVPIEKYSAKLDDYMTYYTKIDKKNNYILDYDGDKVDTIKEFYFVRGSKRIVTRPNNDGWFLLFEYQ